jgi:CHASE2 domain-containing sensor protein
MNSTKSNSVLTKEVFFHSLLIAVLVPCFVLGVILAIQVGFYDQLSYAKFIDFGYQARGIRNANPSIVLVNLGSLPVQRNELAQAIEIAVACKARAIGVDVMLDTTSGSKQDTLLSDALRGTVPVVLVDKAEDDSIVEPNSLFIHPNVSTGYAHVQFRMDEVVRWFRTGTLVKGAFHPSFSAQLAQVAGFHIDAEFESGKDYLINYAGDCKSFGSSMRTKDLAELSRTGSSKAIETFLQGKIILFGYYADEYTAYPIFTDIHLTPLSSLTRLPDGRMYGVEVHANILNTLIGNKKISELPKVWALTLAMVIVLANLLGRSLLASRTDPPRRYVFWLIFGIEFLVLVSLPIMAFYYGDVQLDFSIPIISLLLFPKAEGLYYRFIDNLSLPFRRVFLRRLPPFIADPYFQIYQASSLRDRVSAALNLISILPHITDFLASSALAKGDRILRLLASMKKLRERVERSDPLMQIHRRLREVGIEFVSNSRNGSRNGERRSQLLHDSTSFVRHSGEFALSFTPIQESDIRYEHLFLELQAAIKSVIADLRSLFSTLSWEMVPIGEAPGSSIVEKNSSRTSNHIRLIREDGTYLDLFPFVIEAHCQFHNRNELFVSEKSWTLPLHHDITAQAYLGPSPACFFLIEITGTDESFHEQPERSE